MKRQRNNGETTVSVGEWITFGISCHLCQMESLESHQNLWNLIRIFRISLESSESHQNLQNLMKIFVKIFSESLESFGIFRILLESSSRFRIFGISCQKRQTDWPLRVCKLKRLKGQSLSDWDTQTSKDQQKADMSGPSILRFQDLVWRLRVCVSVCTWV